MTKSIQKLATPRIAIYPGSFDPITNGHLDLIERSLSLFDVLIVAVAINPRKTPLFTVQERLTMIEASLPAHAPGQLRVDSFEGLLVDYAKAQGAQAIVRGLRAVSDFEFEFQMANMNRHLRRDIETVFMMTGEESFYISSSFIRDVAAFGGTVKKMVPEAVLQQLLKKFPQKPKHTT